MKLLMFLTDAETCKACGGADVVRILKFVWTLLDIVLFAIPIGLILIVMIDFGKNVMAGKEDEMKKNLNIAIKRIIYAVVLFLVPTIVSFAISLVDEAVNIQALKCIELLDMDVKDLNPILEQEGCIVDYANLSGTFEQNNSNEGITNNQYKVTFYANEGIITIKSDGSTTDKHIKSFEKDCMPFAVATTFSNLATISREGYILDGWNTKKDGTGEVYDTKKWDCSSDLELYAQWKVPKNVIFNANGGIITIKSDGSTTDKHIKSFDDNCMAFAVVTTFSNSAVIDREGYELDSWNTKKDGNGIKYSNTKKWDCSSDLELYAQWRKKSNYGNEVSVTFNVNGGKGTSISSQKYIVGKTYENLPVLYDYVENSITYVFGGWYTKSNGGNKITVSSAVDSSITTLYAHWIPQYKVTFYANGGLITSKNDGNTSENYIKLFDVNCNSFAVATTFSNSAKIEKKGYELKGWNTKKDGTGKTFNNNTNWSCTGNLDLYAQWKKVNN